MEKEVIDFFKLYGIYDEDKKIETIINTINLSYTDSIDIFEEFLKYFKIEMGYETFDIDKYFYKISFFDSLRLVLNINIQHMYQPKPPITLAHMIEVAKRKEWFDPE
jgi:hypothetical protein